MRDVVLADLVTVPSDFLLPQHVLFLLAVFLVFAI